MTRDFVPALIWRDDSGVLNSTASRSSSNRRGKRVGSLTAGAKAIGVSRQALDYIVNVTSGINPEMAIRL